MKRGPCPRLAATVVAVALVAALPRGVTAAGSDDLIKEGVGLRRKGDDLGALQRFEQAYQLDKSPRALAQMGLAEQALGRWVAAYEHLTQALEAKTDPWMGKNKSAINEALSTVGEHVGHLEVLGGSSNAEVRIDGVRRGTLPLAAPLAIATGTITIDISAPGFVPQQRTTVVRPKQISRESFDPLVAIPSRDKPTPAVAPVTPPGGERVGSGAEPAPGPPATPPAPPTGDQPSSLRAGSKWVAWGLGVAALGLGTFGYVRQSSAGEEFDRDCAVDDAGTVHVQPGNPTPLATCVDRKGSVDSNFRLEVIGFVSAVVLAGAGVALWLTEPKPAGPGATAWGCVPGVTPSSGLWMGCRFQF